MIYQSKLPGEQTLLRLARIVQFPTTIEPIIRSAQERGSATSTIKFLQLFDPKDIFQSRVDFMNQCEEVKMLIRQERETPYEVVYSQQDYGEGGGSNSRGHRACTVAIIQKAVLHHDLPAVHRHKFIRGQSEPY